VEALSGKPSAEDSKRLADDTKETTYRWSGGGEGEKWLVSVYLLESVPGTRIVTAGRSDGAKPAEQLKKARAAALALAKERDFPADKIKEIEGSPLVEEVCTPPDGKTYTSYQWLGGGKGGWWLHVEIDHATDSIKSISGGHSAK
jgi:hypothetical protein